MRVPMIARWPGRISTGSTCRELGTMMDLLPTFCALTGASRPPQTLDGFDISEMLFGKVDAKSQYEVLYYYRRRQLQAIRYGDWKYHLPLEATHPNWTTAKQAGPGRSGKLVNLKSDLQEKIDITAAHPEVIKHMQELLKTAVVTLGNDDIRGNEQRDARTLDSSKPLILKE